MDSGSEVKRRWDWLPQQMPGVTRLVAEKRKELGEAHVNECWRRGMAGEPGYFFAREGALAIGTPFIGDPACEQFGLQHIKGGQALLMIRPPEGQPRGAH